MHPEAVPPCKGRTSACPACQPQERASAESDQVWITLCTGCRCKRGALDPNAPDFHSLIAELWQAPSKVKFSLPARHPEGSGHSRVEVAARDPRGRIDQHCQQQAVADGGSGQASADGVGIAATSEEGEQEHAEELGDHATGGDGFCQQAPGGASLVYTLCAGVLRPGPGCHPTPRDAIFCPGAELQEHDMPHPEPSATARDTLQREAGPHSAAC